MASTTVKTYSVGGAVGIAVSLIGLGFQWKYPDQGWIGKWVAITGFAILTITVIAFVVRWLTIREFERQHPQIAQPVSTAHAEAAHGGIHIPINVGTIQQNADQRVEPTAKQIARETFAQPHSRLVF